MEASGAAVIVSRRTRDGLEYLVLHRAAPPAFDGDWAEFDGDWAWTPPSGVRDSDETVEQCARRELLEEAGIDAPVLVPLRVDGERWAIFLAEVPKETLVTLSSEHDGYRWVTCDAASELCNCSTRLGTSTAT